MTEVRAGVWLLRHQAPLRRLADGGATCTACMACIACIACIACVACIACIARIACTHSHSICAHNTCAHKARAQNTCAHCTRVHSTRAARAQHSGARSGLGSRCSSGLQGCSSLSMLCTLCAGRSQLFAQRACRQSGGSGAALRFSGHRGLSVCSQGAFRRLRGLSGFGGPAHPRRGRRLHPGREGGGRRYRFRD